MPEKRLCEFVACQKHPSPSGGRAGAGNPFCAATIVTPNGTTVFLPTPALEKEALARPIQNKNACPASEGEKKNGYTGLALAEVSLVPARFSLTNRANDKRNKISCTDSGAGNSTWARVRCVRDRES